MKILKATVFNKYFTCFSGKKMIAAKNIIILITVQKSLKKLYYHTSFMQKLKESALK